MGQVNFDTMYSNQNSQTPQSTKPRINYFSLKDDGDEAIVRIMHDSTSDFDICDVHQVTLNGSRYQKVNCIRTAQDPIEKCPLCESGNKIQRRIFIHLIEYVRDDQGNIVAVPKVWDRPIAYAYKLRNYIENYGPLSTMVCKIKRKGAKGSTSTDYDIMYGLRPDVYRDDLYPRDDSLFTDYKALGHVVWDKDYDSMVELVSGKQESNEKVSVTPVVNTAATYVAKDYQPVPDQSQTNYQVAAPANQQPVTSNSTYVRKPSMGGEYQANNNQPWANRPRRTY